MELNNFVEKLRGCKLSQKCTGYLGAKVSVSADRKRYTIYKEEIVKVFGEKRSFQKEMKVYFKAPREHLTIFEADMLYLVFAMNQRPRDYAQFHKCQAGREFIESIEAIVV